MQSQSAAYIGPPGTGKSNLLALNILDKAKENNCAFFVFDLPGTLADTLLVHLVANGMEKRTEYDALTQIDKVIQYPMFHEPTSTNPLQRDVEFRTACGDFVMPFLARRGEATAEMRPLLREWAMNAARVFFSLPERPTLNYFTQLFDRRSEIARWMLQNATDKAAVREFEILDEASQRFPSKWMDAVQPARRLMEPTDNPTLYGREGKGEIERLIKEKKIVLENLKGVSDETARAHVVFKTNAIIEAHVSFFEKNGRPIGVSYIVLEETGYLKLLTPQVLNAVRAYRKAGLNFLISFQSPYDLGDGKDLTMFNTVKDLFPTVIYFRLASGAEAAAEHFMNVSFDAKEVLDYRTKTVHDGYEQINKLTTTTMKDEHGNKKTTEAKGIQERAVYRQEQEAVYKTPQQKLQELSRLLSELKTGQVMIRSHDTGTKEPISTPLLGDPWPSSTLFVRKWGMTLEQKRLREILARVRSRPLYKTPTMTPEESFAPSTTTSSPASPPKGPEDSTPLESLIAKEGKKWWQI